jgi:tetratricopeptide (TPR) repeat protein
MHTGKLIIGLVSVIAALPHSSAAQLAHEFTTNHNKGELYIKKHDFVSGVVYLQRAYDVDPGKEDNAYDLALAYFEAGMLAQSQAIIDASLARHDNSEFHNLLGDVEAKEGHLEAAAEQYRAAAQMDPSEKNLFDLGTHLLRYHGLEAAAKVLCYAVARYPRSARIIVALGVAYYSIGRYDDAIEQLCRAVDLDPSDTRALDFLGKMYDIAPEKGAEVTSRLARFAHEYPNNAAASYYYAVSLSRTNNGQLDFKTRRAVQDLLVRSVTVNPAFAAAHFELGLLYEEEKNDVKAICEYSTAIKLEERQSKFHYRLARIYQRDGNSQSAAVEYRKFEELKAYEANSARDAR